MSEQPEIDAPASAIMALALREAADDLFDGVGIVIGTHVRVSDAASWLRGRANRIEAGEQL